MKRNEGPTDFHAVGRLSHAVENHIKRRTLSRVYNGKYMPQIQRIERLKKCCSAALFPSRSWASSPPAAPCSPSQDSQSKEKPSTWTRRQPRQSIRESSTPCCLTCAAPLETHTPKLTLMDGSPLRQSKTQGSKLRTSYTPTKKKLSSPQEPLSPTTLPSRASHTFTENRKNTSSPPKPNTSAYSTHADHCSSKDLM